MDEYMGNYRFMVIIGQLRFGFERVNNLSREIDYDTIQVGGMNNEVYMMQSPRKSTQTITFEKAVQISSTKLMNMRPGVLISDRIDIMVLKNAGKASEIAHSYYIMGGLVTKWEISSLDALGNEILVDKFEIAHNGLYQDN